MLLAIVVAVAVAILLLLFFRIARICGWPLAERIVARHERQLERLRSRQPWE